jgi:protoheme IX farnesyltransferase
MPDQTTSSRYPITTDAPPLGTIAMPSSVVRAADLWLLLKPRIGLMVAMAAGCGYWIGAGSDLIVLLGISLGAWMAACGASALNMVYERQLDARMTRTRDRPLASGRLDPRWATLVAVLLLFAGATLVLQYGGPLPCWAVAAAALGYLLIYTPLKTRSSLSTLAGAIPGALPPLVGYLAAAPHLDHTAALLCGVLFLWQVPHVLAIAWIHREDYERAGMPLLAVLDTDGKLTGRQMLLYCGALVLVSTLPHSHHLAGTAYLVGALSAGAMLLACALLFYTAPSRRTARRVFFASLIYLPVVYGTWAFDRI